jgi:MFS family permease
VRLPSVGFTDKETESGMLKVALKRTALNNLTRDGWLLFLTRSARLFAYGSLSVVLVLYLNSIGLNESQTGLLLTLTLIGDTLVSLWLTTRADRIGRRRVLKIGAVLMAAAGLTFAATGNLFLLIIAGTVGVISPSGNEVGPFLSIEQAALSHVVSDRMRTAVFAWYAVAGAFATAIGALFAGLLVQLLQRTPVTTTGCYRTVVVLYAAMGLLLAFLFSRASSATEIRLPDEISAAPARMQTFLGIGNSRRIVLKLSALFALDSFGGGFVVQAFAAYWFHMRFSVSPAILGLIFFGANVLAGVSALLASRLASRFGLVNTMVFTHLPSNVLLILVPLMPTLFLAVLMLFLRFSISQMDVPTRHSYTMAVVRPEERSATAGITGVARTTGAAVAPLFAGFLFAQPRLINLPFFIAGLLKIAYDFLLYREFLNVRPPEEMVQVE